jgi:secreted trypsin-like serine protease
MKLCCLQLAFLAVILSIITIVAVVYIENSKLLNEKLKFYFDELFNNYESTASAYNNTNNSARILLYIGDYESSKYLKLSSSSSSPNSLRSTTKLPLQPNCGTSESLLNYLNADRDQPIHKITSRIVNGLDSLPFNWPWMASLKMIEGNNVLEHFCAGSLIYDNFVITAGHCVRNLKPNQFVVSMGLSDLNDKSSNFSRQNMYRVEKVFLPERFAESSINNDLALIKLERKAVLSRYVATICLPESAKQADLIYGKSVVVTGWGGNGGKKSSGSPRKLQQTLLKVINGSPLCNKYCDEFNTTSHYCAFDSLYNGMTNVCNGDSGGPMFIYREGRYYLFGVVSFVLTYLDQNMNVRCFTQAPSYFSKVPLYVDWIAAKVNENI